MDTSLIQKVVAVAPEMGFMDLTVEGLTAAIASRATVIASFDHGFAVVNVQASPQDDPGVWLQMLYVAPEHRGKGIGSSILKAVIAKYGSEWGIGLACNGHRLAQWFQDHGFHIIHKKGDAYTMGDQPPLKNKALRAAVDLYAICDKLDNCARRLRDDELMQLAAHLRGYAIVHAITTVGNVRRKQTAKAKQHRNKKVTDKDLINFRDAYEKSKRGTPKKGWIKAASTKFEMHRDTIADRMKAIAE